MKKSKLSVGLVTSFIGALALTACNETADVTSKDNSLVELVDYNGETIEIQTDEMSQGIQKVPSFLSDTICEFQQHSYKNYFLNH